MEESKKGMHKSWAPQSMNQKQRGPISLLDIMIKVASPASQFRYLM